MTPKIKGGGVNMEGIDRNRLNAVIRAVLMANESLSESTVAEALARTEYGKKDTLGIDAIPEIALKEELSKFDRALPFITEELGCSLSKDQVLKVLDTSEFCVCISDPMDRSSFLKEFLESLNQQEKENKLKDIFNNQEYIKIWEEKYGGNINITAPYCGVSFIREKRVLFSVLLNYFTQQIYIACELGIGSAKISDFPKNKAHDRINIYNIIKNGFKPLSFKSQQSETFQDYQRYVTFLGKPGYGDNFKTAKIFLSQPSHNYLVYDNPGGPSRILYLSDMHKGEPIGFILANGEKIGEWIHWLPFVRWSKDLGEPCLKIYEVSFAQPWTKDGVLMATTRPYSIFSEIFFNMVCNSLKIEKLLIDHVSNPSKFRSTLVVARNNNRWVMHRMETQKYREIIP